VSTWDIDYHRKRLEEASGHAWAPSADDISGASANVKASRNVRAAVVGATRMLRSTTFVALGCVLVGIAQGVIGLGLFATSGPVVALILGGLAVFAASLGFDLWIRVNVLSRAERTLAAAEAQ
jgi:hypothetical protein